MDPETTQQRLLKNAERLMAEKGIAATSVREITEASEANVAAVNYYFGGKSALLLELLKQRFLQLDAQLLTRIEATVSEGQNSLPQVSDLVLAYFDALAFLGFNSETGQLDPFILLIQRASAEQEAVLSQAQDYAAPGISRLIGLLSRTVVEERRSDINTPVLLGIMFTASVSAMPFMKTETNDPVQVEAIKACLVAGVDAYLRQIAAKDVA
ncbi:TetR/AcrR family transcriptional regulator [Roseibium sp.]|uniref:TetR/AcrR family transcriptional regulator n=1 Tax=Roseibium sp. TaxID=1936156 RepID=UPI003BAE96D6